MDRYADNNNDYQGGDQYLDDNLRYDGQDLNSYGDWRDYDDYGHVWVPRVGSDWRPYTDGRWLYTNDDWFWVSYEPWGWAPYHYGRWGWGYNIGWYWIPGSAFAPAWVSWYDYGDYIGWCPLNFYNRPIFFDFYYNNYHRLPPIQKQKTLDVTNSWTFVKKNELGSGNIKRIVAPPTEVRKIRFIENKLSRTPQRNLVNYVIPKTITGPGYVNDKRPLKSPEDIRNPLGVDHRRDNLSSGRVDTSRDRGNDSKKRIAPADKNNNRDREFERGPVRTMPDTVRRPDNSDRSYRGNNNGSNVRERNPYSDRDSQFSRGNDSERHYRSFISPYYRERNQQDRDNRGSDNRDGRYEPYYRNFGQGKDNGDNRDLSPRHGDEAKRIFERFDANRNQNSNRNNNSDNNNRPAERIQRPDPPRHDYRPATPPPQQRENRSRSNGGGQKPPDKHH